MVIKGKMRPLLGWLVGVKDKNISKNLANFDTLHVNKQPASPATYGGHIWSGHISLVISPCEVWDQGEDLEFGNMYFTMQELWIQSHYFMAS